MSRFFVGQRVRVVYVRVGGGRWQPGVEGRIVDIRKFPVGAIVGSDAQLAYSADCTVDFGGGLAYPSFDQIEPIDTRDGDPVNMNTHYPDIRKADMQAVDTGAMRGGRAAAEAPRSPDALERALGYNQTATEAAPLGPCQVAMGALSEALYDAGRAVDDLESRIGAILCPKFDNSEASAPSCGPASPFHGYIADNAVTAQQLIRRIQQLTERVTL